MATSPSLSQIVFVQTETSPGTINNSSGSSTVANGDAMRIISCSLNPTRARIDRPDKTTSLTAAIGQAGRRTATGTLSHSLAGSGSAGTRPDCDEMLAALFGKASTVVASTSVTYALEDASAATPPHVSIFSFRDPSTMDQEIAFGTVLQSARFRMGQDVADVEYTFEPKWVISNAQFSTADSTAKGGLTSMPSRPSAPTYQGNFAIGFTGAVTLDGNSYTALRSATITIDANRQLKKNLFGSYYPGSVYQQQRSVTVQAELDDDDTANLASLKRKAMDGTAVNMVFQIGAVAGNIWTFTLTNVLMDSPTLVDGDLDWGLTLSGRAYGNTGKDEVSLVLT